MIVSPNKVSRFATAAGSLAVLLAFLATTGVAQARPTPDDDWRSSDTKAVVAHGSSLDPAIATAIASHRTATTFSDRRSPDTRDVAVATAVAAHRVAPTPVDLRSPDTRDAAPAGARRPATPLAAPSKGSFDWTTLGLATGGAIVLLVALGAATLSLRVKRGGSVSPA